MICSNCKADKPEEEFALDPTRKRGRYYWCKECNRIRNRTIYYPKNAHKHRAKHLKRNYGLSIEDYEVLYKQQKGLCKICECSFDRLDVDHDHSTGNIRGLLCQNCNRGLGMFNESSYNLRSAINYLDKSG